ncbi:MAG: hypothetical protein CM1200mP30_22640 [Pseudomonadota bacterium]|nr:MAG: hypothetical protein CM1200mP30_22640 [Pseudomonadota bacterium]
MSRAALVVDGEAVMKVMEVGDKTKYGATLKELPLLNLVPLHCRKNWFFLVSK